ncbi:uncharacterized protein LOC113322356 [Papaver somniferum]|uniref:uncharacterized protein LOC113322356 n=1 Tax=Papaver somniferum TaxID=3469 RepID=UPI000E704D58|nr:uncharacterized protein LOC113322356 [Papaver somniferum]
MFRSAGYKLGANLKRAVINGEASSSRLLSVPTAAKYTHFTETRVASIFFYSFSSTAASNNSDLTTSDSDSSNSFVVFYLINSCGLSQGKAYGFTELHISKLIPRYPSILSSKPDKTLKPRFDFFISKGLYGIELANFIPKEPLILTRGFNNEIIPSFDILKSIVQTDQNVIQMIKRNNWIFGKNLVKRLMVNLEILRNEGVPETKLSVFLNNYP